MIHHEYNNNYNNNYNNTTTRTCAYAREGGPTGLLVQLQGRVVSPLRACVREGGVTSGIFTCKLFTGLRACVREGGVA